MTLKQELNQLTAELNRIVSGQRSALQSSRLNQVSLWIEKGRLNTPEPIVFKSPNYASRTRMMVRLRRSKVAF